MSKPFAAVLCEEFRSVQDRLLKEHQRELAALREENMQLQRELAAAYDQGGVRVDATHDGIPVAKPHRSSPGRGATKCDAARMLGSRSHEELPHGLHAGAPPAPMLLGLRGISCDSLRFGYDFSSPTTSVASSDTSLMQSKAAMPLSMLHAAGKAFSGLAEDLGFQNAPLQYADTIGSGHLQHVADRWRALVCALTREPLKVHGVWQSSVDCVLSEGLNSEPLTTWVSMAMRTTGGDSPASNVSPRSFTKLENQSLATVAIQKLRAVRPHCRPRLAWDVLGVVLLLHDIILLPFGAFKRGTAGLTAGYDRYLRQFDLFAAAFWTADIVVCFLTGYYSSEGILETGLRASAVKYLRTYFGRDFFIVLFDWVQLTLEFGPTDSGLSSLGKTAMRFTRGVRLLRVVKMSLLKRKIKARVKSEHSLIVADIIQILLVMILLNHYIACAWYGLSTLLPSTGPTWIATAFGGSEEVPVFYAYTSALHWSWTQFTPASMEIFPTNTCERLFNIVVIVMALVFFSSFVSSITNAMTHIRDINAKATKREETLRAFFSEHRISSELMGRIWHLYRQPENTPEKHRWTPQEDVPILDMMPNFIRDQIQEEVYAPVFAGHPLLCAYGKVDADAMGLICRQATSVRTVRGGEWLLADWSIVHDVVFVVYGALEYHHAMCKQPPPTVSKDEWACEAALWLEKVGLEGPLVAAAAACDAVLLNAKTTRKIISRHRPSMGMLVRYANTFADCFGAAEDNPACTDVFYNSPDLIRQLAHEAWDAEYGRKTRTSTFANIQRSIMLAASRSSSSLGLA